jgi:hypothetical protein
LLNLAGKSCKTKQYIQKHINRQVLKTKWSISVKRAEKCVFGWDEEEIGT